MRITDIETPVTEQEIFNSVALMQSQFSKPFYVWQLTQQLWDREFMVLTAKHLRKNSTLQAVRCLRILSPKGFHYCMDEMIGYVENKHVLNLYYSLAVYDGGIPQMESSLWKRTNSINEWNEIAWTKMKSYDCLIDIDSPDHKREHMELAKYSARKIIEHLNKYQVPYHLRFSGMGYHLVIPYSYFKELQLHFNPHGITEKEITSSIYYLYNEITRRLNEEYSELVDTGLHDSRRVTKMPYSLVHYPIGVFMAWEFLTKEEFENTDYMDYKIYGDCHFKGETKVYNRGLHLFNEKGNNPKNFLKSLGLYN